MTQFDHERLDVYRVAIDFIVSANDVAERLPRGRAYVADQLLRAGTSISMLLRIVAMLTQIVRRREEAGTGSGTRVNPNDRDAPGGLDQNRKTPG